MNKYSFIDMSMSEIEASLEEWGIVVYQDMCLKGEDEEYEIHDVELVG